MLGKIKCWLGRHKWDYTTSRLGRVHRHCRRKVCGREEHYWNRQGGGVVDWPGGPEPWEGEE